MAVPKSPFICLVGFTVFLLPCFLAYERCSSLRRFSDDEIQKMDEGQLKIHFQMLSHCWWTYQNNISSQLNTNCRTEADHEFENEEKDDNGLEELIIDTSQSSYPLAGKLHDDTSLNTTSNIRETLSNFYDSTEGHEWAFDDGWNDPNICYCEWYGIACEKACRNSDCEDDSCPITAISLPRNNLRGDAYTSLSILNKLKSLTILDLSFNHLSGTLPTLEIPLLESLKLSYNKLGGRIPSFYLTPRLLWLDLSNNQLQGSMENLAKLPNVIYLNVTTNMLDGSMVSFEAPNLKIMDLSFNLIQDDISSVQQLASRSPLLESLRLSSNKISGSLNLHDFAALKDLQLYVNLLTGSLPDLKLPQLVHLDISVNQIVGSLPDFSMIPSIRSLYLQDNLFTDQIPDFSNTPQLVEFFAINNGFTGTIPNFSKLCLLENIGIAFARIQGTLPSFDKTPNLVHLRLFNNNLTGTVPNFDGLCRLYRVDVNGNLLTGSMPVFSNTPQLSRVRMSGNQLSGELPEESHSKIELYLLDGNMFNGSIPDYKTPSLRYLDLSFNSLEGTLPDFQETPLLLEFEFSHNQIEGGIPSSYSNLTELSSFVASWNRLEIHPESSFWFNDHLFYVDLSYNEFNIDIWHFLLDDYSTSYPVKYLYLQGNQLRGSVTSFMYHVLQFANEVDFSHNQLTELEQLTFVRDWKSFDVSNNPMKGPIPESYESFVRMEYFNFSGTQLRSQDMTSPLPQFLEASSEFSLSSSQETFSCPVISGKTRDITVLLDPDYYGHTLCECQPNHFGKNALCIICPVQCDCPGGSIISGCYPGVVDGVSTHALDCPNPKACNPDESKEFGCADGYEDHLCSKCSANYYKVGFECLECPEYVVYVLPITSVLVFALLAWYMMVTPTKSTGFMKILLFHIQTLSIVGNSLANAAQSLVVIFDVGFKLSSITFPASQCLFTSTNHGVSDSYYSLVRLIIFSLASFGLFRYVRQDQRNRVIYITLFFLQTLYYEVTQQVFGILGCTLYDDANETWYLAKMPWVQCSPISGEYLPLLIYAIIGLLIFVIGFPFQIYRLLRDCKPHADDYHVAERFGFLFLVYKKERYYWEIALLLRRMVITFVVVIVPFTEPAVRNFLLFSILQISIFVHQLYQPYASETENRLEMVSLYTIYITFFASLLSDFLDLAAWLGILVLVLNMIVLAILLYYLGYQYSIRLVSAAKNYVWRVWSDPTVDIPLRNRRVFSAAYAGDMTFGYRKSLRSETISQLIPNHPEAKDNHGEMSLSL
eukprot:TRINITY_DN11565_c0_g1_i1.p1 TRINITY_DN11565_c0_g1~~TRINITY_DN11565_c0_g1_i1.p1  ORF type:complete len:1272 (-),score=201.57 TRINITY_DN11565_c0_g1_i1:14-3829(-)